MRKSLFLAAAGAGLLLTGCHKDIMGDHRYRTIPVDGFETEEKTELPPMRRGIETSPLPVRTDKTPLPKYEPMVGAVSSGGVDSAPGRRSSGSAAGRSVRSSSAAGTYVVKSGDTLGGIARRHGVRLSALMKVNNMDETSARKLRIGQKLTIPGKENSPADAAVKTAARGGNASGTSAVQNAELSGGKYRIKPGDTPERIARRYKIKLADLLKANNLDDASSRKLQVGQELIIPGKAESAVTVRQTPAAGDPSAEKAPQAEKSPADAGVQTPTPTAGSNESIDNPETMASGNDNLVYKEVPHDMTFAEFAALCGVTEEELRNFNGGNTRQILKKGEVIFFPKK